MDIRVKFGDSMLNSGQIIQLLPAAPVLRTFVQYLMVFCSRPETAWDVISSRFVELTVPDESDRLNRSREIRPKKAVGCGIYYHFSNFDKCWPEAAGDIISGVASDYVGMDIHARICDSRLNIGLIIRLFGRPDPF